MMMKVKIQQESELHLRRKFSMMMTFHCDFPLKSGNDRKKKGSMKDSSPIKWLGGNCSGPPKGPNNNDPKGEVTHRVKQETSLLS